MLQGLSLICGETRYYIFKTCFKQFVRNLLKRGKAGMKYRLKSSDLEPKKLIPKLVVTKSSFL